LRKKVVIVGSLISPSFEKIMSLRHDIVFLSEEDSLTQSVDALERLNINHYRLKRNRSFDSIGDNYLTLGKLLRRGDLAKRKLGLYTAELYGLKRAGSVKTIFLVSCSPLVTVAGGSYINTIIEDSGGINVYGGLDRPYPVISLEAFINSDPDIIISMAEKSDILLREKLRGLGIDPGDLLKKLVEIKPGTVSSYTPADYVESVKKISSLIKSAGR